MLTCAKKQFTGRLSCSYDRPYRLPGCWEAALISFTKTEVPVYIMCDLLEYTDVNQNKYQLLDYFYSSNAIKGGGYTPFTKVLHKRFNTINIEVKTRLDETEEEFKNKKIFAQKEEGEVTCLIHFRRID